MSGVERGGLDVVGATFLNDDGWWERGGKIRLRRVRVQEQKRQNSADYCLECVLGSLSEDPSDGGRVFERLSGVRLLGYF